MDQSRQPIPRLQQGASAASTTLMKTMIDANSPASVKVPAAEAIFNHAAKAIEIEDIEARVSELERTAEIAFSLLAWRRPPEYCEWLRGGQRR